MIVCAFSIVVDCVTFLLQAVMSMKERLTSTIARQLVKVNVEAVSYFTSLKVAVYFYIKRISPPLLSLFSSTFPL